MMPEPLAREAVHTPTATDEKTASPFDGLRRELGRPDLDDEILRSSLCDVIEHSAHLGGGSARDDLIDRVLSGHVDADIRRAVVASLCLPAPKAPMSMPMQALEGDRRLPMFARLFARTRRVRVRARQN